MSVMVPVLILKLTWLDHQRPARSRQDRKSRGAHQPLNAIDDKVPRADVEDFKLEKLRSFAGRAESQPVVPNQRRWKGRQVSRTQKRRVRR